MESQLLRTQNRLVSSLYRLVHQSTSISGQRRKEKATVASDCPRASLPKKPCSFPRKPYVFNLSQRNCHDFLFIYIRAYLKIDLHTLETS